MTQPEIKTITIKPGTMINYSNHEDDEPYVAIKELKAQVVGGADNNPLAVVIPEIDTERMFFIHQPEKKK